GLDRLPVDPDGSLRWLAQPRGHLAQFSLARAGDARNAYEFSGLDGDGYRLERDVSAVTQRADPVEYERRGLSHDHRVSRRNERRYGLADHGLDEFVVRVVAGSDALEHH